VTGVGVTGPVLPCDSTFTQAEATAAGSVPERRTGPVPERRAGDYPPRLVPARVVDIAGVPIVLRATDDERGAILDTLATGFVATMASGVATLSVDAVPTPSPTEVAHSELFGVRFWQTGTGCVIAGRSMVIDISDSASHAHLPDLDDALLLEGCGYLPLGWMLAGHRRFMVHGAAVERDGTALLLLGNSGAGKSTLAAAALDAGWRALSDDLTILEPTGAGSLLHGVHKAPAIPAEIGGQLVERATHLGDPRERVGLAPDVLTQGGHRIGGVLLIVHADSPSGSLRALRGHEVLPLLMQSFAGSVEPARRAAFFSTATQVCRLPLWELGHSTDPAVRRARAAHHLDVIASALIDAS
jgi:hypothetical protein